MKTGHSYRAGVAWIMCKVERLLRTAVQDRRRRSIITAECFFDRRSQFVHHVGSLFHLFVQVVGELHRSVDSGHFWSFKHQSGIPLTLTVAENGTPFSRFSTLNSSVTLKLELEVARVRLMVLAFAFYA